MVKKYIFIFTSFVPCLSRPSTPYWILERFPTGRPIVPPPLRTQSRPAGMFTFLPAGFWWTALPFPTALFSMGPATPALLF